MLTTSPIAVSSTSPDPIDPRTASPVWMPTWADGAATAHASATSIPYAATSPTRSRPRPQRPFGVVLVGDGGAEQGEDAVAGDVHDRAAVASDRRDHPRHRLVDDDLELLGLERLAEHRRAGQVGEQRGDDLLLVPGDRAPTPPELVLLTGGRRSRLSAGSRSASARRRFLLTEGSRSGASCQQVSARARSLLVEDGGLEGADLGAGIEAELVAQGVAQRGRRPAAPRPADRCDRGRA